MRDHTYLILGLNLLVYGLLCYVHARAERNPRGKWARFFYVRQFGPRTDTARMTAAELARSAAQFGLWGAAFLALVVTHALLAPRQFDNLHFGILFCSSLFMLMWFGGAIYLLCLALLARLRQGRGGPHGA
jgi:hypothetical protein